MTSSPIKPFGAKFHLFRAKVGANANVGLELTPRAAAVSGGERPARDPPCSASSQELLECDVTSASSLSRNVTLQSKVQIRTINLIIRFTR